LCAAAIDNLIRPRLELLEPRLYLSGTGLTGQYFFNDNFTGLADTRTEAVAQNWGTASPGGGIGADKFSVRWTGQVQPRFTEHYTFTALSDEAVQVWIDGKLIIDDWSSHTARYSSGSIDLVAEQLYDIRVDYREGIGAARMELNWFSASQSFQIVPSDRLYVSPAGLLGTYSDTSGGSRRQVDSTVDFNWGTGAPAGLTADHFQATWTGQVRANYSELYNFATTSDDGVRLWIAGEVVIDDWSNHTATVDTGSKWLEAGKWYDLKVEYYENTGAAQIGLRWSSARQTGTGAFQTIPASNLQAAPATPETFTNPLGDGADPYVVQWNGMYYLVRSAGNAVWIDRSSTLENIHNSTPESDSIKVWSPPTGTDYSQQVWAPELHFLAGKWYIYVAASDGNNSTHRMQVLERNSADPFGAFTYKGNIAAATDRWAIDGTAFEWQGAMYFVWSGWPGTTDGQQNLYIAAMDTPWSLSSNRVLISTPTYSWEQYGLPINEGPEALIHDGTLSIIYSASGYWTNQYALGRLTYNGVGSLLSASSWTKASQPVFQATAEVTGVGHASFTKSPDGTEDWIVYHAHANPTTFNEDRVIRIQPFTFSSNGTPNFGQPAPPGEVLDVPSSGPDAERLIVAGDYQADGKADNLDYALWRKTFGATVFSNVAADGSANGVVDAADFVLWRKSVSAPASQLAVAVEGRDSTSEAKPQVLVDGSSLSFAAATKSSITALPLVPANELRHASAKTYDPIALPGDERRRDEALIAWLVQRREREKHPGDARSAISGDELPVDEDGATTLSTLDATFASLAV
jgi:GH43 family beta-xylosidase